MKSLYVVNIRKRKHYKWIHSSIFCTFSKLQCFVRDILLPFLQKNRKRVKLFDLRLSRDRGTHLQIAFLVTKNHSYSTLLKFHKTTISFLEGLPSITETRDKYSGLLANFENNSLHYNVHSLGTEQFNNMEKLNVYRSFRSVFSRYLLRELKNSVLDEDYILILYFQFLLKLLPSLKFAFTSVKMQFSWPFELRNCSNSQVWEQVLASNKEYWQQLSVKCSTNGFFRVHKGGFKKFPSCKALHSLGISEFPSQQSDTVLFYINSLLTQRLGINQELNLELLYVTQLIEKV